MKKRYILLFFAILFGIVAFILINSVPTNAPLGEEVVPVTQPTSNTSGLNPEPAPVVGNDRIVITAPAVGKPISSPLTLSGKSAGWYFEGSFPVDLTDDNGKIIAQSYVTAQGDWMTAEFVPFLGTIKFTVPAGVTNGYLVFKKDNPSGEPQYDQSFSLPVTF